MEQNGKSRDSTRNAGLGTKAENQTERRNADGRGKSRDGRGSLRGLKAPGTWIDIHSFQKSLGTPPLAAERPLFQTEPPVKAGFATRFPIGASRAHPGFFRVHPRFSFQSGFPYFRTSAVPYFRSSVVHESPRILFLDAKIRSAVGLVAWKPIIFCFHGHSYCRALIC
jgi:hypothetical protein